MIPCLYDSREMKFDHNGIGKLADAQSCTVTEKRNGSYELKLICPADGIHAEMLEEGNIILAKSSDTMQPQPFRIYKITTPIDGKLEVQARHISYQLNFITVSPFSVTGCVGAMRGLKSHAASDCPFNVWADVESSATFTLGVPSSFRNCLGGMAGSVLDVFGGEFEWDRYTVKFHKARGADHNVHIIYGKNLTDFKMEKSIENTITGVHPYWVDNETQAVMELPEKVVLQSKRSIPYQKITVLDCTSNFQEKPSEAALREYAQNYIDTTDLTEPEIDIKIDFLQLWNTPGYEDIVEAERVSLCDTVHGRFPIDIYLLSDDGDVLGMFNLTLNVARAAITNRKIATLTYKQCVDATMSGIQGFYISEDGYLVMESDDELGLMKGSYSSTMEKVAADVYDKMVNSSIDGNGYLNFQSWDDLGLVFSLDEESQLVVQYGEEKEQ